MNDGSSVGSEKKSSGRGAASNGDVCNEVAAENPEASDMATRRIMQWYNQSHPAILGARDLILADLEALIRVRVRVSVTVGVTVGVGVSSAHEK